MYFIGDPIMKFSELRKRKLNKSFLFFFPILVMLQGLALGHNVLAYTGDFSINTYTINNVSYTESLRAIANEPILLYTYDNGGATRYVYEVSITINNAFPANDDYYSLRHSLSFNMEYPSNANVLGYEIKEYNNSDNNNVSLYSSSISTTNHLIRAYFRVTGRHQYIRKSTSYINNLVNFTLLMTTSSSTRPTLSFTNVTSSLTYVDDMSYIEIIQNAIENSESAEDIADILINSGLTLSEVRSIANSLGVVNNHLTYIQEYAYAIYQILNEQYPTSASEALSDAQDNLESINQDIVNYSPPTVSDQQIISDGQSAYMSMQLEGDTDNLFWYLNWSVILSLVTLIFSLAIISYIIYGKYS